MYVCVCVYVCMKSSANLFIAKSPQHGTILNSALVLCIGSMNPIILHILHVVFSSLHLPLLPTIIVTVAKLSVYLFFMCMSVYVCGVCVLCVCVHVTAGACTCMHTHESHGTLGILSYHSLLYSFETWSVIEPGIRLEASKSQ